MIKRSEGRKNPFRERKHFDVTDFPENSKVEVDEADDDGEEQGVVMDKGELVDMEG